eukprot:TRINITY_DN2447_c0_g1_i5.p1 TRINITY_DN2447_c0_g1~~TRINITY_DN2447_c0_g1_i5.p1  ORF type:complete len:277 (+),score=73.58 TRINITY_DN2447_c0_g1_i5:292-1122(+)
MPPMAAMDPGWKKFCVTCSPLLVETDTTPWKPNSSTNTNTRNNHATSSSSSSITSSFSQRSQSSQFDSKVKSEDNAKFLKPIPIKGLKGRAGKMQRKEFGGSAPMGRGGSSSNSSFGGGDNGTSNGPVPNCQCGTPSRSFTVRKESVNKGRQFFKCANYDKASNSSKCSFFLYADEWDGLPGGGRKRSQPSHGGAPPPYSRPQTQSYQNQPSSSNYQQNRFSSAQSSSRRPPPTVTKKATSTKKTATGKKPPRCSVCRELGHRKNSAKCKMRQSGT